MDLELMKKIMEIKNGGKVLDIGCGTGENSVFLAMNGFDVHGFDISDSSLLAARNFAFKNSVFVDFFKKDARNFRTEESFDVVLCLGIIHFISREEAIAILKYMKKNIKIGGIFVVEGFLEGFRKEEIKNLFSDWNILEYKEFLEGSKIKGRLIALRLS